MLKPKRLHRDERDEHQWSSPRGPVHEKKNRKANRLARSQKQDYSARDDREGQRKRQSGSDAVSDNSKENLAHGIEAKREAENNRCYGRAISDSEKIDDELREDAVNGEVEKETCDCYKPKRTRPDGLGEV